MNAPPQPTEAPKPVARPQSAGPPVSRGAKPRNCASCGGKNPPKNRFCVHCGKPMEVAAAAAPIASPPAPATGGGSTQILQDAILEKLQASVAQEQAVASSSPQASAAEDATTIMETPVASEAPTEVNDTPAAVAESPKDDAFSETSWFMTTDHIDDLAELANDNIEFDEQAYARRSDLEAEIRKKYSLNVDPESDSEGE